MKSHKELSKQQIKERLSQFNAALKTCLEQENIAQFQATMDQRGELIQDFFNLYQAQLDGDDLVFFEELKRQDKHFMAQLEAYKLLIAEQHKKQKTSRHAIRSYQDSQQKRK